MAEKNTRLLPAQSESIRVIVSKAPICSPIIEDVSREQTYRDLFNSYKGLAEAHTKIFSNEEEILDWDQNLSGDRVAIAQMPGLEAATLAYISLAVSAISAVAGFLMFEEPEPISEGEKERRVQGDKNQNKGYEPLPYILGKRKVVPAYAATPYTEQEGEQQYYYMLLHLGYGPLKVHKIKIGDTPLSSFSDDTEVAFVDWYENTDFYTDLRSIWSQAVNQNTVNSELPEASNFITTIIPTGTGPTKLVYTYPQGLMWTYKGGRATANSVQFQYQGSDGEWYTPCQYGTYNGMDTYSPINGLVKDVPGHGWVIAGDYSPIYYWENLGYKSGLSQGFTLNPSLFLSIPASAVVYDDGNGFAIVKGDYALASKAVRDNSRDSFTTSFSFDQNLAGSPSTMDPVPFRARSLIQNYEPKSPIIDRADLLTITRTQPLSAMDFEDVIGLGPAGANQNIRQVVLALKIRASEQLSGVLDDLNVIVESVVPSDFNADWRNWWSDTNLRSSLVPTKNPADLYKWVLQGPMNPARVGIESIDIQRLADWRANCAIEGWEEGWEVSALVNEASTLKDILSNIAKAGRAQFTMENGKFSVVENKERTVPVQVFTPKNSRDFSSKRQFATPSDGMTIEFQNENEDFEVDEYTYYDPNVPLNDRVNQTDNMQMWGIAKPELAQRHARFAFLEKKFRRELYTLTTDIEGLVARRGSMVRVASDIIDVGLGQGFITSVSGSNFTLDETLNLVIGNTYGVSVRGVSGGVGVATITAVYQGGGEWVADSIPSFGLPVGALCAYGEVGLETLDCIVQSVTYSNEYEATLTLVNAANFIYTLADASLPPYETGVSQRPSKFPPAVPSIQASLGPSAYDAPTVRVRVFSGNSSRNIVDKYLLQYRIGDESYYNEFDPNSSGPSGINLNPARNAVWTNVGFSPASDGTFQVPVRGKTGLVYYFRAKAYGMGNLTSEWSQEVPVTVSDNPAPEVLDFTITEYVDTPKTPDGIFSTLEIEIEEPAGQQYSFAIVEYRTPAADPSDPDHPWFFITNIGWESPNKASVQVSALGAQYEFRVRSVSAWGEPNKTGLRKVFTTTNVQDPGYNDRDPFDVLPVPNVRGLELFGQGNNTEFGGKDAKFTWKRSSASDWVDLGYEGLRGAGASRLDQYFRDYQVEIWAGNDIVRTEFVTDNFYVYTFEKNAEDYQSQENVFGAYRDFQIRVYERGRNNQISRIPAKLEVSNTPPLPLSNLSVSPGFNVLEISYDLPQDLDFAGVDIWVSTTQGFDPDVEAPVATTSDNSYIISGLISKETYYARLRPFDEFGRTGTNTSSEFLVTTKDATDLTGLSGWAYEIDPVDRTFIENNMNNDAVPSEKIVNLTAAKLTAGTINATGGITTESIFRAVDDVANPQYQVGLGPTTIDGSTYLMWAYDSTAPSGGQIVFGIDELGGATFTGAVSITGGSTGIANLNDAGALATKDDVDYNNDVTGSKPPSNATYGADWGSTLSGIPARVSDNATVGLNLTNTYLGYYDGSQFRTYIKNDGSFHFGGAGDNYLDWNGSILVLKLDTIGSGSSAGTGSIAFGGNAQAATDAVAIGTSAKAIFSQRSIAVGKLAEVTYNDGIAIGHQAKATAYRAIALGTSAIADENDSVVIGYTSGVSGSQSVAVGHNSAAAGNGTSLGSSTQTAASGTALGTSSIASTQGVSVGAGSWAAGSRCVAIGAGVVSQGTYSVSIGFGSDVASVTAGSAFGYNSYAAGNDSTALGSGATVQLGANGSTAIGKNASESVQDTIKLGTSINTVIVDGTFHAGTKNFRITDPTNDDDWLVHSCYEGPVSGGTIYRYDVTTDNGTATLDLPHYFDALNKDVVVMCQANKHFGRAYAEVVGNTLTVTSDQDGDYHLVIMGTRKDEQAIESWQGDIIPKTDGEVSDEFYSSELNSGKDLETIREEAASKSREEKKQSIKARRGQLSKQRRDLNRRNN